MTAPTGPGSNKWGCEQSGTPSTGPGDPGVPVTKFVQWIQVNENGVIQVNAALRARAELGVPVNQTYNEVFMEPQGESGPMKVATDMGKSVKSWLCGGGSVEMNKLLPGSCNHAGFAATRPSGF